jgi:DNA-binding CsgD family transcriptional regulator
MSEISALANLSSREKEIFDLLLEGKAPKAIGYGLKISYATIKFHQSNLYAKLDIQSIQELFAKYSIKSVNAPAASTGKKETAAVYNRWRKFEDELGSVITVKPDIEFIQEQNFATCTISGELTYDQFGYAGATVELDPASHEAMKKMSSFCFTVLGDGNSYYVMLPTNNTLFEGEKNHYHKVFTAKKHEITTITVNINELVQSSLFGKKVPFVQNNIEFLQFQPYTTGEFNLKLWNVIFFE